MKKKKNGLKIDYTPIKWDGDHLYVLDQRSLPKNENYVRVDNYSQCLEAIGSMLVRGAPLVAYTGLFALYLYLSKLEKISSSKIDQVIQEIEETRPTAVNLKYELSLARTFLKNKINNELLVVSEDVLKDLIQFIFDRMNLLDKQNKKMGKLAVKLLSQKFKDKSKINVLTICNTGALACGPQGTALGCIEELERSGLLGDVYACETRPYLQGTRLTSYELMKSKIDHKIIVEGAAARLMDQGLVDVVFVGADRIANNGDTANKVGTQMLSILCKRFNIPLIVVAPCSSFDLESSSGLQIEIEYRDQDEVLKIQDTQISHPDAKAWNPSFDISKANDIFAIICEKGVISPVNKKVVEEIYNLSP